MRSVRLNCGDNNIIMIIKIDIYIFPV